MLTKLCVEFLHSGASIRVDTVDGTGVPAKVAAGAVCRDDGVHQLVSADDGIYRAGCNAQCAADAFLFPDNREHGRCELPTVIVKSARGSRPSRFASAVIVCSPPGRATIDRFTVGDRFGVRFAAGVTALRALCLGQLGIDHCDQGSRFGF